MYREVEQASLAAWPGLKQVTLDGWQLRASRGYTRRANSVQALAPAKRALSDQVLDCERWYDGERLRCAFRITPFAPPALEDHLDERGYAEDGRSHVMVRDLADADAPAAGPELETLPVDAWIDEYARLSGLAAPPDGLEPLVRAIPVERLHACVRDRSGRVVTVGLGVLGGGTLGLFSLVTDRELRGRGHGTRLIAGLLGRARARGAARAYLQILESNDDARRLYARLGFRRAYDYWYRVRPETPAPPSPGTE